MGVNHGANFRPHAVDRQMHVDFTGRPARPAQPFTLEINDYHLFRMHHPFADSGRRNHHAITVHADRKIPVGGSDKTLSMKHTSKLHQVLAQLELVAHWLADKGQSYKWEHSGSFKYFSNVAHGLPHLPALLLVTLPAFLAR